MVFEVSMVFSLTALVVAFGIKNEKLFARAPKISTNGNSNNQSNTTDANKVEEPAKQITEQTIEVEAFAI